jgi:hypothetical protein
MVFESFSNLVMWRAHFLDADKLLMKFGSVENIKQDSPAVQVANQVVFFVLYSISQEIVVGVYESSSPELLELYHSSDGFRGNAHDDFGLYLSLTSVEFLPTTVVNNKYARETTAQHIYTVKKARNGGFVALTDVQATTSQQARSCDIAYESSIIFSFCLF